MTMLTIEALPLGWNAGKSITETADIGTDWANSLTSAVLIVPSAVIPREHNYILNPLHQDFTKIRFSSPEPFYFDDRLDRVWLKK